MTQYRNNRPVAISYRVSHPSVSFHAGMEPTQEEWHLMWLHSKGRLLALPENKRLGWKLMSVRSTQAHYYLPIFMAAKSFIVQTSGANPNKKF